MRENWNKYEVWKKEQELLAHKKKVYREQNPVSETEQIEAEKYGNTLIRAINVMDSYSEDKAEDMENATQAAMGVPLQIASSAGMMGGLFLGSKVAGGKYNLPIMLATSTAGIIASYIPLSILSTKAQVWTSKVARFQAREQELKDPKNFVVYNDEQLEEAKKIAETMPDEKEKKDIKKFIPIGESIATIKSVFKDKNSYKNWHKKYQEEDKQIKASYTQGIPGDKKQKALKDQQLIVNTVKKINLKAEEYSEDVETATQTAGFFAEAGIAAAVGSATNFIINKLSLPANHFARKYKAPIVAYAALIPAAALATYFTSIQKDAARIGRFKAKQELMSDPASFIYEDPEKIKAATTDISAPDNKKSLFSGVGEGFKNLINIFKDIKEYKNYKKTKGKEEEKLVKALKQVEVTDEQLKEARNLQEKTFNAFEKMDDMSQKYSETAEMATDIAMQTTPLLAYLGGIGAATGLWIYAEKKFSKFFKSLENASPQEAKRKLIEVGDKVHNFIDDKIMKNRFIQPILEKPFVQRFLGNVAAESGEVATEVATSSGEKSLARVVFKAIQKPTLRKVLIGAGVPVVGAFVGGLYALNGYFTSIQKKAGKIGVMKAMEELEDPRYFVDINDIKKTEAETKPESKPEKKNSYLERLMNLRNKAA